jgi:hypothetical protein
MPPQNGQTDFLGTGVQPCCGRIIGGLLLFLAPFSFHSVNRRLGHPKNVFSVVNNCVHLFESIHRNVCISLRSKALRQYKKDIELIPSKPPFHYFAQRLA